MNGKKATYARKFALANKDLSPDDFRDKVEALSENEQVQKKMLREHRILKKAMGQLTDTH